MKSGMMRMSANLEVSGLTRRYGSRYGIDGVSFSLGPGLHALIGPNGAGKTTLLRILAGILRPDGGRVIFRGQEPCKDLYSFRQRLGYLPQEFGVYPEMTAYGFLAYLGRLKAIPERELPRRIAHSMSWTGLDAGDVRPLSCYSYGMRQLVGIAQAFLNDPELILLDEPFVGLDPEARLRLMEHLAAVARDRIVLVSTHVISDVKGMNSLLVLQGGRLIFAGTERELLGAVSGLVWQAEVSAGEWSALSGKLVITSLIRDGGRCLIRFVADPEDCAGGHLAAPRLSSARPARDLTLEEAYIAYLYQSRYRPRPCRP